MSFCLPRILSRTSLPTKLLRPMSSASSAPLLLTPAQVKELMAGQRPISILDATWFMPNVSRKAKDEFASKRLPGAQFLDLDEVASPHELGLKHMMPSGRVFADACERLGIAPSSHVIIYDGHGVFSSPRALFMFRAFGHGNSSIIDGGLPRWQADGLPVEDGVPQQAQPSEYPAPILDTATVKSYEQVVSNSLLGPALSSDAEIVVDARSQGRYLGKDPEPRPGLSSGHIPNSFSLPFTAFLDRKSTGGLEYTTFLPKEKIQQALVNAVGPEAVDMILQGKLPITTSCGSGMSAGVLWLGLKLLGVEKIGLYDESWTGYAMRPTSKIEISH
ncbi:hypothetical protein HGRIS_007652 [Hohenbuehelia grisea]|uniref:Rhodanese domain-containing protein n=1 Tax=Hohenbuehelia grisea TaxID=104357 RepID=A0ABR3J5X1_9AGAR